MHSSSSTMRFFAWLLIPVGVLIAIVAAEDAKVTTRRNVEAWVRQRGAALEARQKSARGDYYARLDRIGMLTQRLLPAWTTPPAPKVVSPWPGVHVGAAVAAFGIVLLTIRRPTPDDRARTRAQLDRPRSDWTRLGTFVPRATVRTRTRVDDDVPPKIKPTPIPRWERPR